MFMRPVGGSRAAAVLLVVGTVGVAHGETIEDLRRELDAMKDAVRRLEQKIEALDAEAERTSAPAAPPSDGTDDAALDRALAEAQREAEDDAAPERPAIVSRRVGAANLRLIDISVDAMVAAGSSTASSDEIEELQGGAHDPRRRGFTLQQAELSLAGAVDPYFRGEAHVIATDEEIELEEAFITTQALPYGLQVEAGYFLTEFGRINPQHPHQWDWVDQPVINTRLFGGEGLRNPGVRVGWLLPVPWFSELHLGAQNAAGHTAFSFLGEGEEGEEEGEHGHEEGSIGGRPLHDEGVHDLGDLLYLTRLVNGGSLTDTVSAQLGVSALFGPNATGPHAQTRIYGGDLVVKWRPTTNFRGWPFLVWQTEAMRRDYEAAAAPDEGLPRDTLHDWGLYTQALWGFRHQWAGGLRYEFASGSGPSVDGRDADPLRADRHRVSPLVIWQPSEYSRLRLQYNYDDASFLNDRHAHSVWLSLEVLYGAHAAHAY